MPMPATAVARNIPAKIISALMRRIFFIIPTFIISWALHTYILVVKNEGFGDSSIWGKWVNTVGNTSSSLVVWGLVSALIWSFIYSSFKFGPVRTIGNFIKAPFWAFKYIAGSGKTGFGAFLMGSGLALYLSAAIQFKTSANICLAVALSIVGLSQPGFLLATYFAKGWMWVVNFVSKRKDDKFGLNFRGAHLMVVGLSPGFLLCAFLKPQIAQILGIIAIILGVVFFFDIKAPKKSLLDITGLFFIGSIFTAAYFIIKEFLPKEAFADDGGWQESGGTFIGWIKSQGCLIAVFRGVPPSISSSIGPLTPPLILVDPTKIPIDINIPIDTNTLTQMPGGFNDGDTREFSVPVTQQDMNDAMDKARGYHYNPDGSVTVASYKPGMADYAVVGLNIMQFGCDNAVNILQNLTGPYGKVVNYSYIWLKNIGSGVSTSYAKGTNMGDEVKEGMKNAAFESASNAIADVIGPKGPDMSKADGVSFFKVLMGSGTKKDAAAIGLQKVTIQGKKYSTFKTLVPKYTPPVKLLPGYFQTGKKVIENAAGNALTGDLINIATDVGVKYGRDSMD